ncbi:MAP4 protein, partial [Chaetorhynchus papuensis]|nr:MAP4 protein [Chaetorhynchus papuensis]
SPNVFHSKLEQIPELGSQDKERQEAAGKRDKRNGTDGAAGLDAPKSKGAELEAGKAAPPERKEIEVSSVQSSPSPKQGDLPRDAKPEEPKAAEAVTGKDITAPPNKELPPSPEKKTKVGAVPCPPSPLPWVLFASFSASSPVPAQVLFSEPPLVNPSPEQTHPAPELWPGGRAAPLIKAWKLSLNEFPSWWWWCSSSKRVVADAKPTEKRTSLSKPPSSTTPKTPSRSSSAAPRTTAPSPVTAAA